MPANLEDRHGTWHWRQKINGTVHRKTTGYPVKGGRRALELAQRKAVQFETEMRAGRDGFVKKAVPMFGTWAHTFRLAYYPNKYTEQLLLRRPVERWGATPLDKLTRTDIELFFQERKATNAKGGTLERERVLLKRLFRAAVDDGVLAKNPMAELRAFKTTPRTRVMTRDEEARIREVLNLSWNRFLTVALTTGLRLSELLGARPCDLRACGVWLWVRPECNKTRTERVVPLRDEARTALHEQMPLAENDTDVPYWQCSVAAPKVTMKRVCERLGIEPRISCHDLRRTFATRCAEAGMYPAHLQKILGHRDISTTMKYYVHQERQSLADALNGVTL